MKNPIKLMKSPLKLIIFTFLSLPVLIPLYSYGATYTFLDKDWDIQGYVRQEAGWGLHSETDQTMKSWKLRQAYYTAYLNSALRWNQNLYFRMINRLAGDWAYDINHDSASWKQKGFAGSRDELALDDDFREVVRELYLNYSTDHWNIRIGKQQVAWGEADGIRLCDIINPLDISRQAIMRDSDEGYEETRIPLSMIKAEYFLRKPLGFVTDLGFELVYNPFDFKRPRLYVPDEGDKHVSPWGVRRSSLPLGDPGVPTEYPALTPPGGILNDEPARDIGNSQFGMRIKADMGATRATLIFWRGFHTGYLGVVPPIESRMLVDGNPLTITAFKDYTHRVSSLGFTLSRELYGAREFFKNTLNWNVANPMFRIETLYSFDVPYVNRWKPLPPGVYPFGIPQGTHVPTRLYNLLTTGQFTGEDIERVNEFKYMLGFDWPVRIGLINPQKNIFISGQFFHIYLSEGGNDSFQVGPYAKWEVEKNTYLASLLFSTSYLNDKVKPQILFVKEFSYNTWWTKPKIKFEIGDHWRPEIGAIIVEGKNRFAGFGQWEDRDEIYFKLAYQF